MQNTIVIEKKYLSQMLSRRGSENIEKYISSTEETVENMV